MLNYRPTLVSELTNISSDLPVMYELFRDSDSPLPLLTYTELNDSADAEGGKLRYSYKRYRLKLWGEDLAELATFQSLLDDKMYELGFKRENYNELNYNNTICQIIDYRGLALERYSEG